MSCNIQLNTNGKILSVNADNGEKSLLFATLSSLPFLSKEQAAELYLLAKKQATKNTIKDVNGEPQIVFQPLGGEHEYLLTDKMVSYTDFYKALSLDTSERGVRFGILTTKNVEEFSPTNSLEHKKLVEIAKKADSTKTTISTNNTYISDNPKDFTLIDKFDRATNTNSKDGFLASLINLGIKIKPKQKTGIPLAIERNNGNPLKLAPNGEPSILFQSYKDLGYSNEKAEELVAKTYSDEFLAWFGDWIDVLNKNKFKPTLKYNVDFSDYKAKKDIIEYYINKNDFKYGMKGIIDNMSADIVIQEASNLKEGTKRYEKGKFKVSLQDMEIIKSHFEEGYIEIDYKSIDNSVSMVVDKNNQPKLVFHSSMDSFNTFKPFEDKLWEGTTDKRVNGFYFTDNRLASMEFALQKNNTNIQDISALEKINVMASFLNIRKPDQRYLEKPPYYLPTLLHFNPIIKEKYKEREVDGLVSSPGYLDLKESFKGATNADELFGVEYIVSDPNQIKSATENTGDFSLENNDIRFQIIGEQGASNLKNARTVLKNLQVAKKMRAESKDEITIKIATGWEFNKGDEKWRREVDSRGIYKNVAIPKGYNFLFKKPAIPLEEFFKNKELFRLYPQLKEYKVYVNPSTNSRVLGAVSTERKIIMLPFSNKELKTTLIHEIQHIIQDIEGFAVGGSPEMFEGLADNKQKIYKQITTKISRIFQNKNDDWRKIVKPFMIEYLDSGQELYTENIEKLEDFNALLGLLVEYREVIYSGNKKYFLTPEQQYNNLAGEVEARNATFRMGMTVEEKLKSLLNDTQDVKEEDKIYIQEELKEALRLESQESINNSQELLEGVYEQLKKAKVVDNTYFLSNQGIEDKLRELGYSEDIVKQVIASQNKPGFFSNAAFAIDNLKDKNPKNVKGWMKMLTDVQKNGGIRNVGQELNWIGLEDFLNQQDGKSIPFEVVEQYIKDNQIEIVEVENSDNTKAPILKKFDDIIKTLTTRGYEIEVEDYASSEMNVRGMDDGETFLEESNGGFSNEELIKDGYTLKSTHDEDVKLLEEAIKISNNINDLQQKENNLESTKHSDYQLEGGENYREVLLTLPSKNKKSEYFPYIESLKSKYNITEQFPTEASLISAIRSYATTKEMIKVKELKSEIGVNKDYNSSHWSEKNILAHIRMNERTLPNGERVMFIEEVQSDWAQDGKKKGFNTKKATKKDVEEIMLEAFGQDGVNQLALSPDMAEMIRDVINEDPDAGDLEIDGGWSTEDVAKLNSAAKNRKVGGVPQMPYKKTDQWLGLTMRKVYQMAAQEGFDRVTFITGEQSADRYSLKRKVESISVEPKENSRFVHIAMEESYDVTIDVDNNGNIIEDENNLAGNQSFLGKKLEDVIGKEMSERVMSEKSGITYEEQDLEVGGEGMKTFYNSIVPKVAKKEAQRFDKKAKVDVVDFGNSELDKSQSMSQEYTYWLVENNLPKESADELLVSHKNKLTEEQKEYLENFIERWQESDGVKPTGVPTKQLSIKITPKMKDALQQKVPQFSQLKVTTNGFLVEENGQDNVYINLESKNPTSVILHEHSHGFLNKLKQVNPEMYQRGLDLANSAEAEAEEIKKFVRQNQPNLQEGTEAFANEVLAEISGRKAFELLSSKEDSNIKTWLTEFFDYIRNLLGLTDYTNEQVAQMSLNEFAEAIGIDLLKGNELFDSTEKGKIKREAIKKGNYLKAPNGEYSKLNEEQWLSVRTISFKDWFGDWENSPETASKVVDENGEPLVVYHGGSEDINVFDERYGGETTANNDFGAFYFSNEYVVAEDYSRQSFIRRWQDQTGDEISGMNGSNHPFTEEQLKELDEDSGAIYDIADENLLVQEVFLNIKDPLVDNSQEFRTLDLDKTQRQVDFVKNKNDDFGEFFDEYLELDKNEIEYYKDEIRYKIVEEGLLAKEAQQQVLEENGVFPELKDLDGVIITKVQDDIGSASQIFQDEYIAIDPNQIKSALENTGQYSRFNDDIRFQQIKAPETESVPTLSMERVVEELILTGEVTRSCRM